MDGRAEDCFSFSRFNGKITIFNGKIHY
jgi:hypothetical protein